MQRKLSEIAEIPKILSSTLATVSQTFDKLMPNEQQQHQQHQQLQQQHDQQQKQPNFPVNITQQRKYSYDEDAIDYELSDDDNDEDADADTDDDYDDRSHTQGNGKYVKVVKLRQHLKKIKRTNLKEATPESDYASEANTYEENDRDDDNDTLDDNDENEDNDTNEYNCTLRLEAIDDNESDYTSEQEDNDDKPGQFNDSSECELEDYDENDSDNENDDVDEDDDNDDANNVDESDSNCYGDNEANDDEDFYNTTFTWNMKKIPKLHLNDEDKVKHRKLEHEDVDLFKGVNAEKKDDQQIVVTTITDGENILKQEKQDKAPLDKFERSWPWADREKIIYKQSTCHLVPQKPLGLIEKRIQLLAQRNLLDNLEKLHKQQK
ncbi:serine-aspartate repeat-containing protein F-like [Teleopsis dalmanni]|uniref:serine-aspartate repeat-containing protein F-like n=1 Tax=Teleopsis dalmanni TaxID=139649 RepID=UPI0018CC90B3|nr:serine-aspartate repeat-containing protein F-like [Teleopsis dalmanni]